MRMNVSEATAAPFRASASVPVVALALAMALVIAVALVLPEPARADYGFDLTVYDYTDEVWLYGVGHVHIRVENTGTEADTIDFTVVDKSLPLGWFTAICINGVCPFPAYIRLEPGQSDTVDVDVYVGEEQGMGTFNFKGASRGSPANMQTVGNFAVFCAQSPVLLVDDDDGAAYQTYLAAALLEAGYYSHVHDTSVSGRPDDVRLSSYWAVFWTTADGDASYLTAADEDNMMSFLDNGGNLFLASMDFLSSRAGATTFTSDYLHLGGWTSASGGTDITGSDGDPVGDGMSFSIGSGPFSSAESDLMTFASPAYETFYAAAGTRAVSVSENGHKVVFLSFPFENIPAAGPDPGNQGEVARRAAAWFEPQMGVDDDIPEMAIDARDIHNSPNPFAEDTRISYRVARPGHVRLSVYTPAGRLVRELVNEYVEPGAHWVAWDGRDGRGREMSSGVYYYRLINGNHSAAGKMTLLR